MVCHIKIMRISDKVIVNIIGLLFYYNQYFKL
eukprot:UN04972